MQPIIVPLIRLVLARSPRSRILLAGLFDSLRRDPCHNDDFSIGLDQPNPFCFASAETYLLVGTVALGFGVVATGAIIVCHRLDFPTRNAIVVAGALAAYAYPVVSQSAALRQTLAQVALGLAVLIPLALTVIAIRIQIKSQFTNDS